MEFLTSPHINRLIHALMAAQSLTTDDMNVPQDEGQAFAPILQYVQDWAAQQDLPADEATSLLRQAMYPYHLT